MRLDDWASTNYILRDVQLVEQDAPVKFERLVRQKRFVGAVDLLNESLLNIFSAELVDVPAVASVRDEMLVQKGKILDTLVEEIVDVLFLRATTAQVSEVDKARGAAKSRRRRERRGGSGALMDDSVGNAQPRGQGIAAGGGVSLPFDAGSESSTVGDAGGMMWAGTQVDVTDVGDHEEQALDDPSQEFSVYLRLLVEAVRRLRCLDDVERYLLERLPNEVWTLSATHMRTCVGKHEEVGANLRTATVNKTKLDGLGARDHNLTQYLSLVFDSFTSVLANVIRLVRLLHAARLRDLREHDPGAAVFEADAPYKESLVVGLWQHMQAHLIDVFTRHVSESQDGEVGVDADRGDAVGTQNIRLIPGPSGVETSDTPSPVPNSRPLGRPESSSTGLTNAGMELNHVSTAEYCRSRVLTEPSPMVICNIFRPTLKFVEVEEASVPRWFGSMVRLETRRAWGSGTGGKLRLAFSLYANPRLVECWCVNVP